VGCVGTINANKNQQLLLDALVHLSGCQVVCVFVGEGGDALRRRAKQMGIADRVLVRGYQPDAERWMPAFDVIAVPSLTEGQGLVVLEAFRSGVPVLASNIAPLRQLVIPGHTGWLFDSHDARDLANVIESALSMPPEERTRVTDRARTSFLTGYTVEQMVARHDRLYERLRAA
jgi:glycosyltransferase involved in cell wall biosynthesis